MKLSSRLSLASVALVCLTAAAVGWLSQRNLEKEFVPSELERVETDAKALAERVGSYVQSTRADVLTLRGAVEVDAIVRARNAGGTDPRTGRTEEELRRSLGRLFASLLSAKPQYLQARLIGAADGGREIVRVDRIAAGRKVRILPDAEMQEKGNRPYFRDAVVLRSGAVYVSPLELNREHGRIEVPHVPVVRTATPVHGPDGRAFGILIINVDMRPIFAQLRSAVAAPSRLYVVNAAGDYLVHPDRRLTFGFDLGHRHRIQYSFPTLAGALRSGELTVLQASDSSGALYGVALAPVPPQTGLGAYVVQAVPRSQIMASVYSLRWTSLIIALAVSIVAIAIAVWLARSLARPIRRITAAVEANGASASIDLPTGDSGEVGILARAVERFIEREQLFRATLESANDAIITLTLDGIITSWNAAAEALFGYTGSEAVGRSIDMVVPDERRPEEHDILTRIAAGDDVHHHETVRVSRDGRRLNVSLTISPVRDRTGAIVGASKIARDLTSRMRLQEMVRLAVDACPAGMIIVNREGHIDLANAAAANMFGYSEDELLGQSIDMLVPHAIRDQHVRDRTAYQAEPDVRTMGAGRDLRGLRKDGSVFPVEVGLNPISTDHEIRVLAVVVDITERRRAEAEIEERTKELERSNAELAQFAYVASHDLQEPLRMVASFCDLLKESYADKLDEDGLEYIEFAVDGARRMQQLITDLLAYSRLNTRPPEPTRVSSAAAVQTVIRNLGPSIQESGAEIEFDDLPDVLCDRTQIEQLFQNLISNAIKFRGEAAPRIRVSARRDGAFWCFSVTDNGIGIDPIQREGIFGIFQRLHTREEYPGTGIGLAVCKRIVERQGGAIWVEDSDGQGTTFSFTLPVAEGADS